MLFFNSILGLQGPPRLMYWLLSEGMADDGDNEVERDDDEVERVVEVVTWCGRAPLIHRIRDEVSFRSQRHEVPRIAY